jgi:hypothetical protein
MSKKILMCKYFAISIFSLVGEMASNKYLANIQQDHCGELSRPNHKSHKKDYFNEFAANVLWDIKNQLPTSEKNMRTFVSLNVKNLHEKVF